MEGNNYKKTEAVDPRIEAEVEKLRADARQADAEATKIKRELARPWYRGALFLQAIAAGLVAVPIVWFYVKEVAIPLHGSQNIKLQRQIEESLSTLSTEKIKHAEAVKILIEEKEETSRANLTKLNELRGSYEAITKSREELKIQYETLLTAHQLTSSDRDKVKSEYEKLESSIASKSGDISRIDAEIEAQFARNISVGDSFARELKRLDQAVDSTAADYAQSIAVVVGIDSYEDTAFSSLPGVSKDIEAVAKVLERQKFSITTLINPTRVQVLETFGDLVQSASHEDRVLVYWAGHGFAASEGGQQRGYLATKDCSSISAFNKCIAMEKIPDLLERLSAKSALALIDASHAGLALPSTRGFRLISNFEPRFSKEIISASDSSGVVFDTSHVGLGPFAAGISDGIGKWKADFNRDGIVRTSELFQFMSSSIVQLTQGRQVPSYASLAPSAGEFLFIKTAADSTAR